MLINTQNINNFEQLVDLLKNENNSYSVFILSKLDRDLQSLTKIYLITQKHHIIPCHLNGPDSSWNLIRLTIEEHATAHELLYEH